MIQRAKAAPTQRVQVIERSDLCGILIRLDVEHSKYLFLRMGSDGAIQRLGTSDRDIVAGTAAPELFQRLIQKVNPALLRWVGQSWADPAPKGKLCLLVVGFRDPDGQESMMRWEYGSESYEPPPEVLEFVMSAVEATNPWLAEHKSMERILKRRRPESAGWHLVPLLPV